MAADKNSIHVMHVVRSGLADGGMQNGIINVTNRIDPGFRISLCALAPVQTFSERITRDCEYILLPKSGGGIDWGLIRRLAQVFRASHVDLVHSHNWGTFLYAVLAAQWAGVPIVHGEHGKNPGEVAGDGRLKKFVKTFLGRKVTRLVSVCESIAREWESFGIPAAKIKCIPNGVDSERFCPRANRVEARREFGLPDNGLTIGSIGRLDELKNYAVLVGAFARISEDFPNSQLALIGTGPCEPSLRAQAAGLGISERVHFLGWRSNPQIFLNALDIFVLPSLYEGMSNVVLEAMAAGLPVVCADLESHHELMQPGREGVLLAPCTVETLALELAALGANVGRRCQLGDAARAHVMERFTMTRMVTEHEKLYRECARLAPGVNAAAEEMLTRI